MVPLSGRVIQNLDVDAVASLLAAAGVPEGLQEAYWIAVRGNVETRADAAKWWPVLTGKAEAIVAEDDRAFVEEAFGLLSEPPYDAATWAAWTAAVKKATGRKGKGLFLPLRQAITGQSRGPEMAEVMALLQVKPKL